MKAKTLCNLHEAEARTYSQNGEDGVLASIFDRIGVASRYFVEFGAGTDGSERNTRLLQEQHGWDGLLIDCAAPRAHPQIRRETVNAENINALFAKYRVPDEFDLLSIDIDGNDYWVWKAISTRYRPRVLIIEYNASFPPPERLAISYDPHFRWRRTDYYGGSLQALADLSRRRGYELVYCESRGVNAFFIRADLNPYLEQAVQDLYRPADYLGAPPFGLARLWYRRGIGHLRDRRRRMIEVE